MNSTKRVFTSTQSQNTTKLKAIIATMLMLIFYIQSWAIDPQNIGSELYVTAQSGLHMRTTPDAYANSLKVIPLGDKVTVLSQADSIASQKINWVTGNWVLVEHEGDKGYIFDGYLSTLATPMYEWEMCQLDMDMIYPLEQWSEINHMTVSTDTVSSTHITKVTDTYMNGNKLVKINAGDIYKIELHLKDVRIMDAYHLLQNMLEDKTRVNLFKNESIFIEENFNSDLKRVKIKLDNPIDIRKLSNGDVKISIYSQEYPCTL